ncbi:EboA domain-containing protein [Chromobacterium vaccinii]|uniref:EboA domain-containing protein n=1 Tax=Chromobacterium vaccinii TaxID=1108595 RepID=UPI003C7587A5
MLATQLQAELDQAAQTHPDAQAWLRQLPAAVARPDAEALQRLYAAAARKLRPLPPPTPALRDALRDAGAVAPADWSPGDIGRLLLLLLARPPEGGPQTETLPWRLFRGGDAGEQQSLLRALPLLPRPEAWLELAVDACRSHIQGNFEAIACENSYPARFFPEANFNQLVLKALFTGASLLRVDGLRRRLTPELLRMVADMASERRAADRAVPADIQLVLKGSRYENV